MPRSPAQTHVETLRRAHQAFSAHDLDAAARLVANEGRVQDHGRAQTFSGREAFRQWMASFLEMSSDIAIVDARYIAEGDWVTAQFRAVGKQDGPMPGMPPGMPGEASGRPFSMDVCEVWHFNDRGEADEGHNYSDGLGLLRQLGHLPASA